MKSLITGIGGFVGSHLAEHLLSLGHEVSGLLLPEKPSNHLDAIRERLSLHEGDILDREFLRDLLLRLAPDRVFHLAAQSAVPAAWAEPARTLEVNTLGGLHLMDACLPLRDKVRLIVVGSAEIYGGGDPSGVLTEESPVAPQNPYAVSKLALDLLAEQYAKSKGLWTLRMRPMNHVGPRQEPTFVVADFAKQVAEIEAGRREPLIRVGNLDSRRDFTDVRDVARAYALAADKGARGEAYLVCSGKTQRVGDVLEFFTARSRAEIAIETDPEKIRPADPSHPRASSEKLRSATGWRPEIPFEKTLSAVLEYWRAQTREIPARS